MDIWPVVHAERKALASDLRSLPDDLWSTRSLCSSRLTLRAADTQSSTGTGPEVSGPILSLLMAMTGPAATNSDLTGDGLQTLAARP